ncbi:MAG: SDR family oxidoreductase [Acidimicrobiales bacterium]|nr:SDR family oxidoreductase [Acidimicrobiales bacterium]
MEDGERHARVLEGTVGVVTGAGQGMGRGIALALAAEGAQVALVGRTRSKLEAVAAEVRDRGSDATVHEVDVTDRAAVLALAAEVLAAHGRVDVLVNAAYDTRVGRFDDLSAADARHDWHSGAASTLWCVQAFHPALAATRGSVINVGAATGLKPDTTTFALYASTKEAIRSLTRTMACELAVDGIRVNALIPLASSPSFTQWADDNPDDYRAIEASIPLRRMGDPEDDVGPAAVFLASEDAHYVTGTTLLADGGRGYLR